MVLPVVLYLALFFLLLHLIDRLAARPPVEREAAESPSRSDLPAPPVG